MLSLFAQTLAFQGPAPGLVSRSSAVSMRAEGEIGVTPPLGVYDPLNILATPVVYRAPRNHRPVGPAAPLMWARCE